MWLVLYIKLTGFHVLYKFICDGFYLSSQGPNSRNKVHTSRVPLIRAAKFAPCCFRGAYVWLVRAFCGLTVICKFARAARTLSVTRARTERTAEASLQRVVLLRAELVCKVKAHTERCITRLIRGYMSEPKGSFAVQSLSWHRHSDSGVLERSGLGNLPGAMHRDCHFSAFIGALKRPSSCGRNFSRGHVQFGHNPRGFLYLCTHILGH